MAEVINMPRLSDTMEEGTVATWLKKVGDKIEEGDILAEIETDKATMEFESFYEGTLLHIGLQEGETAPVDTLLAIIGEEGEDISDLLDGGSKSETVESESEVAEDVKEEASESQESTVSELPEGVEMITMPRLSDTMTEGTIASWLKKEGDEIEEGDILAEIETDKATMEFESFYSGTLLKIEVGAGESSPVDTLIAVIGPEGTDVASLVESYKKGGSSTDKKETKKEAKKETKKETSTQDKTQAAAKDAKQATPDGGRIFASPLARRMAEDKGIDLRLVNGSGENGRIVKADIENYQPAASAASYIPVGTESFEERSEERRVGKECRCREWTEH